MKVPHSSQRRGGGTMEINMTPMIDMVFLLIVYFVWTSGDLAQEMPLPSRISEQSGTAAATDDIPPPEADFDPVVVRIVLNDGTVGWRVNDERLGSLDQLRAVLQRLAEIKADAPVVLHPDPAVPLGDVIDVYDLSRVIGFEKIQFATGS